jgi:hypothetical protein
VDEEITTGSEVEVSEVRGGTVDVLVDRGTTTVEVDVDRAGAVDGGAKDVVVKGEAGEGIEVVVERTLALAVGVGGETVVVAGTATLVGELAIPRHGEAGCSGQHSGPRSGPYKIRAHHQIQDFVPIYRRIMTASSSNNSTCLIIIGESRL